jgi:hypothetical protein
VVTEPCISETSARIGSIYSCISLPEQAYIPKDTWNEKLTAFNAIYILPHAPLLLITVEIVAVSADIHKKYRGIMPNYP